MKKKKTKKEKREYAKRWYHANKMKIAVQRSAKHSRDYGEEGLVREFVTSLITNKKKLLKIKYDKELNTYRSMILRKYWSPKYCKYSRTKEM